jgi:hypothetical protein
MTKRNFFTIFSFGDIKMINHIRCFANRKVFREHVARILVTRRRPGS